MGDKNTAFRNSLFGGFNRKDVLGYIESRTQNYTTKLEELSSKLEQSTQELTETRKRLNEALSSVDSLRKETSKAAEELSDKNAQLTNLFGEMSDLQSGFLTQEEELRTVKIERDSLSRKVTEMRAMLEAYEQAKIHVAEMEIEAHRRASKIELDAQQSADQAQKALLSLLSDAKQRYVQTEESVSQNLHDLCDELARVRDQLLDLPRYFNHVGQEIDAITAGIDAPAGES